MTNVVITNPNRKAAAARVGKAKGFNLKLGTVAEARKQWDNVRNLKSLAADAMIVALYDEGHRAFKDRSAIGRAIDPEYKASTHTSLADLAARIQYAACNGGRSFGAGNAREQVDSKTGKLKERAARGTKERKPSKGVLPPAIVKANAANVARAADGDFPVIAANDLKAVTRDAGREFIAAFCNAVAALDIALESGDETATQDARNNLVSLHGQVSDMLPDEPAH